MRVLTSRRGTSADPYPSILVNVMRGRDADCPTPVSLLSPTISRPRLPRPATLNSPMPLVLARVVTTHHDSLLARLTPPRYLYPSP